MASWARRTARTATDRSSSGRRAGSRASIKARGSGRRASGVQCAPVPRPRLGGAIGIMFSTSEDGRVIGGAHSFGLESEAVLWIDRSPSYLKDYLRAHGVPTAFDGWVNTGFITRVSPNGRILVGYGAGPRDFQGLHRDPRGHAMSRLAVFAGSAALLVLSDDAGSGAIVGGIRPGRLHALVCARSPRTRTESARHQRRVHMGRAGRAFLHTAVGRGSRCGCSSRRRNGSARQQAPPICSR